MTSANTNTNNKVKDIPLNEEFTKEFGFISARLINGFLTLRHHIGDVLRCQFDIKKLGISSKRLGNAIAANEGGIVFDKNFDSNKFVKKFIDLLLDDAEQEHEDKKTQEQEEIAAKQKISDEIDKMCKAHKNTLTPEQWRLQLLEKYQNVKNVINEKMPMIWPAVEYTISIMQILKVQGCNLPFIGIILGRPSSYKTVALGLVSSYPHTYYTDNYSPKAWVTHTTAVQSKDELEQIDMLPKVRNNTFLTPELSPQFTKKEEDLNENLGIMTRLADGEGYSSDSGAHGHRSYEGSYMFTWVGAAVDIPYKVYKILSNLGAKIYFFRTYFPDETNEQLLEYAKHSHLFGERKQAILDILHDYLKWLDLGVILFPSEFTPNTEQDDEQVLRYISSCADLLSYLRCIAKVWKSEDTQGSEYSYSISQREVPHRAITALLNLARGHALLVGRNYVTLDDVPIVIKTILDSAQIERVSMFSLLMAYKGVLNTSQVVDSLRMSRNTALRTMAEFHAIGLVDMEDYQQTGQNNNSKRITINPRFEWFINDSVIKKILPYTTYDVHVGVNNGNGNGHAKLEDIFWSKFNELLVKESENPDNFNSADKDTVNGDELRKALLLTGNFYNGDVDSVIKRLLGEGKLAMPMINTYRKQ